MAKLARRSEVPTITASLKRIASDEGRHAAHGWDVVEWCVREGGDSVVRALEGAVLALPTAMRTPLPEEALCGAWERWGIHGSDLEASEYAGARAHVVKSVAALAATGRSPRLAA